MNIENPDKILNEIKKLPPEEAIMILDRLIIETEDPSDEFFFIRGMKHWALNHRQEALTDYLTAIRINPQSKAKMALQYSNDILDYYNKDLLNP